jgi:hypothetical protein
LKLTVLPPQPDPQAIPTGELVTEPLVAATPLNCFATVRAYITDAKLLPEELGPTATPVRGFVPNVFPVFDAVSVYVPGFTVMLYAPLEPEMADPVVGPPPSATLTPTSPAFPLITYWLSETEVLVLALAVPSVTVTLIDLAPAQPSPLVEPQPVGNAEYVWVNEVLTAPSPQLTLLIVTVSPSASPVVG